MGDKKDKLFNDFPPVPSKDWMEKITEDLKGSPFEKLVWKTGDGISIAPFYRKEDLAGLEYLEQDPFVRTGKKYLNDWEIRQDIDVDNYSKANEKALHALNWGATSICFNIPENTLIDASHFKSLLKGIFFECININFHAPGQEDIILQLLQEEIKDNNIDPERITGSINLDPLGQLSCRGNFIISEASDFNNASELINTSVSALPNFRTTGINGHIFHNAGASNTQELAFSLAMASEYLDRYSGKGLEVDQIARSFQLNLATGPLFFIEIAKIRAARLLFSKLVSAWKPQKEKSAKIFIHASTSEWNQTVFDPYINMLRGTTEGMAAALGGADSITLVPFDKPFRQTTKFSERIARNTQIILKEEAYFDKVIDPSAGSYYIEKITDSLAENAWKLFLEIESQGGFLIAMKNGIIQNMLNETARQRDMNIATRREILLGTNQYPDSKENLSDDFDLQHSPAKETSADLLVKPLTKYRGAMAFEELRLNNITKKGGKPRVFLLRFGSLNWRIARSIFATNFFGCAGYEILDTNGFETIEEGVESALKAKASIVVLCSSDEQYPVIAPEALNLLKGKALLVIAGFPKDHVDELKNKGVEHFIHMKSNVHMELAKFNEITGSTK